MDRFSPAARTYVSSPLPPSVPSPWCLVGLGRPASLPILAVATLGLAIHHRRHLGLLATTSRWYLFLAAGVASLASIALLAGILPDFQGALADALWYAAFVALPPRLAPHSHRHPPRLTTAWKRFASPPTTPPTPAPSRAPPTLRAPPDPGRPPSDPSAPDRQSQPR